MFSEKDIHFMLDNFLSLTKKVMKKYPEWKIDHSGIQINMENDKIIDFSVWAVKLPPLNTGRREGGGE